MFGLKRVEELEGEVTRLTLLRPGIGTGMTDEKLLECLGVDGENHVLKGVREVIRRFQAIAMADAGDAKLSIEERLAGAVRFAAAEDLEVLMEGWRREGVKGEQGRDTP